MRDLLLWINPSSDLMRSGLEQRDREKSPRLEAGGLEVGGRGNPDPGCLSLTLKLRKPPRVSKVMAGPLGPRRGYLNPHASWRAQPVPAPKLSVDLI